MSFKILLIKWAVEPFPFVPTIEIIFFGVDISSSKIKSLRIERSIFSWLKSLTFLSSQLFTDKIIYLCSLLINPDNLSLSSRLSVASRGLSNSYGPTEMHIQSFKQAKKLLENVISDIIEIEIAVDKLVVKAENSGSPKILD